MGLLAYNPYDPRMNPMLRNVTPFVAPQTPEGQGAGPALAPPAPPPQAAPMPQPNRMQSAWQGLLGTSGLKPGAGIQERMNAVADGPLFNTGMALLAASAPGATGADFVNQIQNYRQGQLQREQMRRQEWRENREDKQNDMVMSRQQTAWNREDEQRTAWQAAVNNEQDPQRRATLQALGPQGYGDWMAGEQQRAFQAREGQLDRETTMRAASIRSANENSLGRYFQAMDAETLGTLNNQSAQLSAVGLPQLNNLRNTIVQAGSALTGQPIDYNTRITLGRYFNGSSAERQTLEVWRAQILGPALETLRGLGAMSEREMEAAINSFSNPDMTLGAALQLLDERIAIAQNRVAQAEIANEYFQQYGGLTGVGPGWSSYLSQRLNERGGGGGGGQPPPQGAPQQAPRSQGYPSPSSQDVQTLRRDSSAERRRQFDEVYGPGAAARALAGQMSGRGGASRPLF